MNERLIRSTLLLLLTSASVTAVWAMPGRSVAQDPAGKSVWDGVYAEEQSKRGETLSQSTCVSCHGEQLSGSGVAPPVQGEDFREAWSGRSAGELFDKILTTMPADRAGTLKPDQAADLAAYIFKLNDFPTGQAELPSEMTALNGIKIRSRK